jgi:hypothetical protein
MHRRLQRSSAPHSKHPGQNMGRFVVDNQLSEELGHVWGHREPRPEGYANR